MNCIIGLGYKVLVDDVEKYKEHIGKLKSLFNVEYDNEKYPTDAVLFSIRNHEYFYNVDKVPVNLLQTFETQKVEFVREVEDMCRKVGTGFVPENCGTLILIQKHS